MPFVMKSLYGADGKPLKRAAAKLTRAEGEPTLVTTHAENLAARKFICFALEDIHYQLEKMSTDPKVSREAFEVGKTTAGLLAGYLSGLARELDRLIAKATRIN